MKHHPGPLQRFSTLSLIFTLSVLALSWPLLAGPGAWPLGELFRFLFVCWGLLVAVLWWIARTGRPDV